MFNVGGGLVGNFHQTELGSYLTYCLPLDVQVAGQDDLRGGDLHFLPLEDQV